MKDCGCVGARACEVFFFQAEDGIRDYKVTGVQTCALPISQYMSPFANFDKWGLGKAAASAATVDQVRGRSRRRFSTVTPALAEILRKGTPPVTSLRCCQNSGPVGIVSLCVDETRGRGSLANCAFAFSRPQISISDRNRRTVLIPSN